MLMKAAVFLDRDGVLVEDVHLLSKPADIRVPDAVPAALVQLRDAGVLLFVVSNQTVVARGILAESAMKSLHREIEVVLQDTGAPALDGFYYCPHHPQATVTAYRVDCDCRKPRPGLLLRAAAEHDIDLARSFMIGDRMTDIIAGASAGCRTVLVETGQHLAPPIETSDPLDDSILPDHTCASLFEAARWILEVI